MSSATRELGSGISCAPSGANTRASTTFRDAERAAFASPRHPGLDVTFQHRGSNTVTGSFTISLLQFLSDPAGLRLGVFVVDFEQHSEGAVPALFGRLEYYASDPAAAPTPAPETLLLLATGAAGLCCRRRRTGGRASGASA